MRKFLLLAAVAAAAIASPATARDGSQYFGIEGGLLFGGELEQDFRITDGGTTSNYDDAFEVDFKPSIDLDAIVGHDFGMFRLEAELGYKKLRADEIELDNDFADDFDLVDSDFDIDGGGRIISVMVNGLLDFGDDGLSAYVGGGIGTARVKFGGDKDSSIAYQLIAGVRKAVTPTIDVGLKYRYFRTSKLRFNDEFNDGQSIVGINSNGRFSSHSLLASLIFNLVSAPPPPPPPLPPPPPPPPPPATQTCYDGSVILATDVCPQPPAPPVYVPPPPPEPTPERG